MNKAAEIERAVQERFKAIKFDSEDLKKQLSPIIENISYYNETGKGSNFNSLLITLAKSYPQDQKKVISLFHASREETQVKKPDEIRKDVYSPVQDHNADCPDCPGSTPKRSQTVKQAKSRAQEVEQSESIEQVEESGEKEFDELESGQEVLEFFSVEGSSYPDIFNKMKTFAESQNVDIGRSKKLEVVAERIYQSLLT